MRTPLAWLNLTHDLRRLALAAGGIGFAVLLMFMQLGFRGGMFDSTLALVRRFDADLVLVNPQRYTLSVYQKFPRDLLELARSSPLVASAEPVYFENIRSFWKRSDRTAGPPVRVVAYDPRSAVLMHDEILSQARALEEADSVLLDRKSKTDFGGVGVGDYVEINGRRVRIAGTYALGTDFADDGTVVCSERTFNKLFFSHLPDGAGLKQIDIGLLKLATGVDAESARATVDALLPPEVLVLTKSQFLDFELKYWNTSTPIGYVFMLGTVMGFIVGMVICYQILFADVSDYLREFATLKAMGYRSRYFVALVLQEALLLSVLGYVPGFAAAWCGYELVGYVTGLVIVFNVQRLLSVFALTALMCVLSGCLTMRQVVVADPAEMF